MSIIIVKHEVEDDCPCAECLRLHVTWRSGGARFRMACVLVLTVALLIVAAARSDAATVGRCRMYEPALAAHNMPVIKFSRIMYRESRCRAGVVNRRSGTIGLLQMDPRHAGRWGTCPGANLYSASGNISCAAKLYHRAGMAPWRL